MGCIAKANASVQKAVLTRLPQGQVAGQALRGGSVGLPVCLAPAGRARASPAKALAGEAGAEAAGGWCLGRRKRRLGCLGWRLGWRWPERAAGAAVLPRAHLPGNEAAANAKAKVGNDVANAKAKVCTANAKAKVGNDVANAKAKVGHDGANAKANWTSANPHAAPGVGNPLTSAETSSTRFRDWCSAASSKRQRGGASGGGAATGVRRAS